MELCVYQNLQSPQVDKTIPIETWFKEIRYSKHSYLIDGIRKDNSKYEELKLKLPCITYNFIYNNYKKDSNIKHSTGLLYIDIDNPVFNINNLDLTKIYSYYKSYGGNGYAILVKINNLTPDNFKASYLNVCDQLNILEFIDRNAIKKSQCNVLSYDENIYINNDPFIFNSIEENRADPYIINRESICVRVGPIFNNLRFDNIDELNIKSDYIVDWNGIEIIKCYYPAVKVNKNRNSILLSYLNNLVFLNPFLTEEECEVYLNTINQKAFVIPVLKEQINRVLYSIMKYKNDGTLKPIYYKKKRKIIFNQDSILTRKEKLEICNMEMKLKWKDETTKKLYNIIESWNFKEQGKITKYKIYTYNSISKNSVVKYWEEFDKYVEELNNLN